MAAIKKGRSAGNVAKNKRKFEIDVAKLGILTCPVDGTTVDRAKCMETKALAIKRFKAKKPYQLDQCRMCGASELRIARPGREGPKQTETNTRKCARCGELFVPQLKKTENCRDCVYTLLKEKQRAYSAKNRRERRGK